MIFNLLRKDIILVRKYIFFMIIISFVAPSLLLYSMEVESEQKTLYGGMVFFLLMFVIVLFLSNSVSLIEETYSKGCAYLCTTPYTRKQMVISKYFFSYLVTISYCVIYAISSLVVPEYTIKLNWYYIIISFIAVFVFRSILIPLEYKFGYEKAKYIITFSIIAAPFIVSLFFGNVDISKFDISFLLDHKKVLTAISFGICVVINIVSMLLSCLIFENKDL